MVGTFLASLICLAVTRLMPDFYLTKVNYVYHSLLYTFIGCAAVQGAAMLMPFFGWKMSTAPAHSVMAEIYVTAFMDVIAVVGVIARLEKDFAYCE